MKENYLETKNESTNQVKNRFIHNSRYQKKNLTQRPSNPSRNHTDERFQRPPPNMEVDNIIGKLNKVGFNQSYKTQEKLHEEETNRKAMKDMQESYMEREQINKEKLEAAYRAEIHHLKKEITKQKEANMTNNESALARINMQQIAIDNLQKEKENYKHEVEKITKVNQNYKNELEK